MKLHAQQVGDAGQYFVAAEICRRGGYAVVTPGNRVRIDILANDAKQERLITVQVKTKNHKGPNWFASTKNGHPREEPADEKNFWVLVDLGNDAPEYYVMPAWWIENQIHTELQAYLSKQVDSGYGGERPTKTAWDIKIANVSRWKDRWDLLGIFPTSDETSKITAQQDVS